MIPLPTRWPPTIIGMPHFLLGAVILAGAPVEPVRDFKFDCGVNSLLVLARLDDAAIDVDALQRALPDRHPDGYSMAELIAAAGRAGFVLEGIQLSSGEAIDEPMIIFLEDAAGGHFAVARPVGVTGTMVQVIDPPNPPRILDESRLRSSRAWTGRMLVPRRGTLARVLTGLLVGIGLIGLLVIARRWRTVGLRAPLTLQPPA